MNRKFLALLSIIFAFAFGLASCSSDAEVLPEPDESGAKMVTLVLDLSVNTGVSSSDSDEAASRSSHPGDGGAASRASQGLDFEEATDNYEMAKTLRVIITRPTVNNIVEHNFSKTYDEVWSELDALKFKVISGEKKNLYLIVNESGLSDALQSQLNNIKVGTALNVDLAGLNIGVASGTPFIDNSGAEKSYIPMTESYELNVPDADTLNEIEDGKKVWKPEYSLLVTRATTKFSFTVSCADDATFSKGLQVTDITFSGTAAGTGLDTKEYLFPKNTVYSPGKLVPSTEKFKGHEIISFLTPPTTETYSYTFKPDNFGFAGTDADMTELMDEYTSANYFLESGLNEFTVSITTRKPIDDNAENDIITEWPAVTLPNLQLLPRNTHVKVNMIFNYGNLNCVVTVYPYTAVNLNPEFGFAAPVTDRLTVAPTMELVLNGPDGLLYPKFESDKGNTIHNLYWVSSNPSVVLLGNEVTDVADQRYVEPSDAIELPYLQTVEGDKEEPAPVRLVAKSVGTAVVSAYTQSGLVASCRVTVK